MSITFTADMTGAPQVNMSNSNAAAVLDLLGFPGQPEGQASADDFAGRILLAVGLLDVATDDERGLPDVQDGRYWHGGRRPGYLAGRFADLAILTDCARLHGALVVWS